jgi:adenylate cyclase
VIYEGAANKASKGFLYLPKGFYIWGGTPMTHEGYRRKLTAIMSADVEGYSRLMGEDEDATIRTLTIYRELMSTLIQKHRGRVVDSPGDNLLAEFGSVVDAVRCAVEIQEELRVRNAELPENRKMQFRIGINLGDVVQEGERIYGDGVNITARVEGLAEGGGICISGTVYDSIKNKLSLTYESLGEYTVKNITEPVRVYRMRVGPESAVHPKPQYWHKATLATLVVLIVAAGAWAIWNFYFRPPPMESASADRMPFPLPIEPSIAVMPFENMSGDPKQENIADALSENVIATLSKIPEMIVSARNSTFAYKGKRVKVQQVAEELGVRHVLEGSVLKSGNKLRITAQLVDAIKGHHLWTEQYEREIKDLFSLLDEITNKIVVELQVKLTLGEQIRMWANGTNNSEAWRYVSESLSLPFTKKDNARARDLLTQAVKIDPNYPAAWASLALTHLVDDAFEWTESPDETYKQAYQAIQEALKLDNTNPLAHALLGIFHNGKGQRGKATAEGEKAISLGPNNALVHFFYALIIKDAGQPEKAISFIKKAMGLEPYYAPIYLAFLAEVYQLTGQNEEALVTYKKLLERSRKGEEEHFLALKGLAIICTELGHTDEAKTYAEELFRIKPNLSLSGLAHAMMVYKDRRQLENFWSALRKAKIEPPFLSSPEEFKYQGPPAFILNYPKGKIETEFMLPEKVFKVKAHEGLIDFNVFVEGIHEGIPLKDVGPKVLLPRLEKDVGTEIRLLSNKEIKLKDGTIAYKTKMEFNHRKGFFITCFLISAYKEDKWVFNLAATVGDPMEIESLAESLRFISSGIPIRGDIQHVHLPNNISETHIDIFIEEGFTGKLPDVIDTITVTGPAGELPISKREFRWVPQFKAFWIGMLGEPELGTYTFTVTSARVSGRATDTQSVIRILPCPDIGTFSPSKGETLTSKTPTFSWGAVEAEVPISYMLEIREIWETSIYMTDYTEKMLSYTVPAGELIPGKSYIWRVRVADNSDWVQVQNLTWSEWLNFTMAQSLE